MEKAKKKIWLVNYYAMPPEYESRLRTIKFSQYLPEFGFDVTIFSSSFMHNKDMDLISGNQSYIEREYQNMKFILIKTIKYKKSGLIRVYSLILFHIKLCFLVKKFEKPDIIIHVPVEPFGSFFYFCAKRLKARYFVDILDLWPESFVTFGLIGRKNPFLKIAYWIEKWLFGKADKLIFSMEGGKDYIIKKKWDLNNGGSIDLSKVIYINNGVDLHDFDTHKEIYRIEDPDLTDDTIFRIIYLGSIRHANNVKQLIDAASLLKDNKKIKFLIYGDGDERDSLEKYCRDSAIYNVVFKQKWIEPKFVPYVLTKSSLNILNYMQNAIWEHGGSQSKFFQYLASGKPICSNIKMGYCLISKYNLGISKQFESDQEYADAILSLANLNIKDYAEMCLRVRETAKEFDYKLLTRKLADIC